MSAVAENQVRIEKTFRFRAPDLFRAISKGRLLFNCGGDQESFENDFRVGGAYQVHFPAYGIKNVGRYLEIVQDRKLVFTWGDAGADPQFPKSEVTIELFPDGDSTRLLLSHTGFTDGDQTDEHAQGWTAGLDDLLAEVEKGRVRIVRRFKVSRERLYAACSNPRLFFGIVADAENGSAEFRVGGRFHYPTSEGNIEGRFEVIVPNERIVFTWERACGAGDGAT